MCLLKLSYTVSIFIFTENDWFIQVRKRLEEAGKAGKKAKKGFLTPERKKKLRVSDLLNYLIIKIKSNIDWSTVRFRLESMYLRN